MIYLDNNATTKVDDRVLAAMLPYFSEEYGNPSSSHKHGLRAMVAVDEARNRIASVLGVKDTEIFFTAGATESNNAVLKGVYFKAVKKGKKAPHFLVSAIEHKCVLNAAHFLESLGAEVTYLAPSDQGIIGADDIVRSVRPNTVLVSVMWANNEIGSINPIHDIAKICNERGVLFHTDAAQVIGKINIDLAAIGIDFLTGSAQKFYGPKGTGLLYIRSAAQHDLEPLLHGGGQERGLRSGTLNVPGIVGMAEAVKLFCNEEQIAKEKQRQRGLIGVLYDGLREIDASVRLNGPSLGDERIFNNLNVSLPSVNEKVFNKKIKGLMISSGSACSSADLQASYVLTAIGLTEEVALRSFRMGTSQYTTEAEIKECLEIIRNAHALSWIGAL